MPLKDVYSNPSQSVKVKKNPWPKGKARTIKKIESGIAAKRPNFLSGLLVLINSPFY